MVGFSRSIIIDVSPPFSFSHVYCFYNLVIVIPDGLTEEPIHDRKRDPGAGSVTSYHNSTFIATRNISAGSELFASVGDAWFVHNIEEDGKTPVPFASDYQYVDKIVEEMVEFRRKYPNLSEAQLAGKGIGRSQDKSQ
jgi:hypothetical protein